jgi:uncharacterized protein YegL
MVFKHERSEPAECKYIFLTDSKICIYDTYFVLDGTKIQMHIKEKEEAETTYSEAVNSGYTAAIGRSLSNGLSEFVVGNLAPESICEVVLNCAFTGQLQNEKTIFMKFPLEVCTTNSVATSLKSTLKGDFLFDIDVDSIYPLQSVSSNSGGNWNGKSFSLSSIPSNSTVILTTVFTNILETTSLVAENYVYSSIIPRLTEVKNPNTDFVFVLDCSGSMSEYRIKKAIECLNFFLRSLPEGCQFNIVCFGSNFVSFFDSNVDYNDENVDVAACKLSQTSANLGGTDLLSPLLHIFQQEMRKNRVCQIFVLSDGEVGNTTDLLASVSVKRGDYRIFSIGVGSGADAGLINGIADVSGGKPVFVNDIDDLTSVVVELLSSAISSSVTDIQLHVEGFESFETSPFPVPPAFNNTLLTIIARLPASIPDSHVLCTGTFENKEIEFSNINHSRK